MFYQAFLLGCHINTYHKKQNEVWISYSEGQGNCGVGVRRNTYITNEQRREKWYTNIKRHRDVKTHLDLADFVSLELWSAVMMNEANPTSQL